ncbi:MAG: hypothetical protein CM1200mP2_06260 [Planctomycetaceae bacterium]|nr:MAG: hypothetical protein CM1200mP2_06260 [Planctomycetaceae bacterium]
MKYVSTFLMTLSLGLLSIGCGDTAPSGRSTRTARIPKHGSVDWRSGWIDGWRPRRVSRQAG